MPPKPLKPPAALTHLDAAGLPTMVDVSAKHVTARAAVAESRVRFPAAVAAQLRASGLRSAKGGIVDTAVVAGTLAVKRTHELIPFCHPLPIDGCRFVVDWAGEQVLRIECTVRTTHRTGVEMEALTGASVAALTVYDMCKALSQRMTIGPTRLLGKRGGKRDHGTLA
ncbi:cyclic pyranopterin monophosphate synthase MoaC [Xanthomonas sp. Kuri4-2]